MNTMKGDLPDNEHDFHNTLSVLHGSNVTAIPYSLIACIRARNVRRHLYVRALETLSSCGDCALREQPLYARQGL